MSDSKKINLTNEEVKQEKVKINFKDEYVEKTGEIKRNLKAKIKSLGYWLSSAILLLIVVIISVVRVGDIYRRIDLIEGDINTTALKIKADYINSGYVLTPYEESLLMTVIYEGLAQPDVITDKAFEKLFDNVSKMTIDKEDGTKVSFNSVLYLIYQRESQQIISFSQIESWQWIIISLNVVVGVLLVLTFIGAGVQEGLATDLITNKKEIQRNLSLKANKYRNLASDYFKQLYLAQLKYERSSILSNRGFEYSKFFTEDGGLIEDIDIKKIENKNLKQALKKCLSLRLKTLSFAQVATLTEGGDDKERFYSINKYVAKKGISAGARKSIMSGLFSFVSVALVLSTQSTLQIVFGISCAVFMFVASYIEYLNSYAYVTSTYVSTIDLCILHLEGIIQYGQDHEEMMKLRKLEEIRENKN